MEQGNSVPRREVETLNTYVFYTNIIYLFLCTLLVAFIREYITVLH